MSPSPLTFSEGIRTSSLSWKLSMTSKDYFLKTILNLYKTRIFLWRMKTRDNFLVSAIVSLVSSLKKGLHVYFYKFTFIFTCYKIDFFF